MARVSANAAAASLTAPASPAQYQQAAMAASGASQAFQRTGDPQPALLKHVRDISEAWTRQLEEVELRLETVDTIAAEVTAIGKNIRTAQDLSTQVIIEREGFARTSAHLEQKMAEIRHVQDVQQQTLEEHSAVLHEVRDGLNGLATAINAVTQALGGARLS